MPPSGKLSEYDRYGVSDRDIFSPFVIHKWSETAKQIFLPPFRFDCHFLADAKIPEFLESTGWKNPVDTSNTAFNLAYQKSIFEYIAATPGLMEHFHAAMAASGDFGLHNAVQEVPWPEILGPVEKDNVALVDLGGADGSLLMQILHKYPELTGEFILQDLPDVIEKGKDKLHKRVKSMPHDFFTEEPVKGMFRHDTQPLTYPFSHLWKVPERTICG